MSIAARDDRARDRPHQFDGVVRRHGVAMGAVSFATCFDVDVPIAPTSAVYVARIPPDLPMVVLPLPPPRVITADHSSTADTPTVPLVPPTGIQRERRRIREPRWTVDDEPDHAQGGCRCVLPFGVAMPTQIFDIAPQYPAAALAARADGRVVVEIVVARDGSVEAVRVARNAPRFERATIEAVWQWRFAPTEYNGRLVRVVVLVTFEYRLTAER